LQADREYKSCEEVTASSEIEANEHKLDAERSRVNMLKRLKLVTACNDMSTR
ncbi:hypothetical protein TorRG33x02_083260, partial [Trema orientale]